MHERRLGIVVRGLRAPIIHEGDELVPLATETVLQAAQGEGFEIKDRDVLGLTESVVARAQGNYVSVDQVAEDVRKKFPGVRHLGLVWPILSRNRFMICLKAFARAMDELTILLSYPTDEVGNHLISESSLRESGVNPWADHLNEEEFRATFGRQTHPFTGMDYIQLYHDVCVAEGCTPHFVFSNHPSEILEHVPNVLTCDIHSRHETKEELTADPRSEKVLGLFEIMNTPSEEHGYNEEFGLLGSNLATHETLKLFPRDSMLIAQSIQDRLYEATGKRVEVLVFGDGAFRDPVGKIWELADPVVSPGYTSGLEGSPHELKLKYLADTQGTELDAEAQAELIRSMIRERHNATDDQNDEERLGTTPRRLTDLLGSLCDLSSGSGDKGTPFIYIQGYFDNFASE